MSKQQILWFLKTQHHNANLKHFTLNLNSKASISLSKLRLSTVEKLNIPVIKTAEYESYIIQELESDIIIVT